MPQLEQDPIDPEIAATLDAIDATLAGEPVDGRYADIAEIALLLASERPQVPPAFASSLDQKVERRFEARGQKRAVRNGPFAQSAELVPAPGRRGRDRRRGGDDRGDRRRRRWRARRLIGRAPRRPPPPRPRLREHRGDGRFGAVGPFVSVEEPEGAGRFDSAHQFRSRVVSLRVARIWVIRVGHAAATAPTVQPPTTGRKVVQGAQLNLTAAPNRVDDVAQEIYDVVGQANGIVENSSVTQGGPGGYANFQLSMPSARLGQTMTQLSSLNYAQVVSRTDSSQDITDQYGAATRALADARALRTSLLKQLASAATTDQVDSVNAQIIDAEASISSDQATLNRLNHQVDYSELYVTVQPQSAPPPIAHRGGGGFTLGRAAHDAGRVLMVGAGVALIAIAVLAPIGLLVAVLWWVGSTLKRRHREQALDSV